MGIRDQEHDEWEERPEPVLDAARAVAIIMGCVGGAMTTLALFGLLGVRPRGPGALILVLSFGVTALLGVILPLRVGKVVRELVTPMSDPRSDGGVPLLEARDPLR